MPHALMSSVAYGGDASINKKSWFPVDLEAALNVLMAVETIGEAWQLGWRPASAPACPYYRILKYKLVGRASRNTRFRSIIPAAANSFSLCLMLAADHMPNWFQSNLPVTAFSSPTGTSFSSSRAIDTRLARFRRAFA